MQKNIITTAMDIEELPKETNSISEISEFVSDFDNSKPNKQNIENPI